MTRSRHARRSYSSSSEHGHSRNRVRFNSDERSPLLGYRAVGNHPHLKVHLKSSQFVSTCLDLDVGKSEALAIFDEMDELHKGYVEADDIAEYIKRKEQELAELSKYYTSPEFWCMFIFLFSTFLRMMDNLLNLQFWCTDSIAFIGLFLGSIGNVVVALNAIKERKNSTRFHEEVAERLLAMKGEITAERKERRRRESFFIPAGSALIKQEEAEKLARQDSASSTESSIFSPEELNMLRRKSREMRGSIIITPEQAAKLAYEHDHPKPLHNPHPNGEHDHDISFFGLNHFGPS